MNRIAVAAALMLAGCSTPPSNPDYFPRPVVPLARWQIEIGDQHVGELVQLEIRDPAMQLTYYRIEDPQGRWVGHATDKGRFSRRVPFRDEEEDLGVWSLRSGVAQLFDAAAGDVTLTPIAVEADWRKEP